MIMAFITVLAWIGGVWSLCLLWDYRRANSEFKSIFKSPFMPPPHNLRPYMIAAIICWTWIILTFTSCRSSSSDVRKSVERETLRTIAEYMESADGHAAVTGILQEGFDALFWANVMECRTEAGSVLAAVIAGGWGLAERGKRKNGKVGSK
jgi:hypothetical protein